MKDKYIEKAIELLDKPWWKDKPYSNAVHCVAGLLKLVEQYNERLATMPSTQFEVIGNIYENKELLK